MEKTIALMGAGGFLGAVRIFSSDYRREKIYGFYKPMEIMLMMKGIN